MACLKICGYISLVTALLLGVLVVFMRQSSFTKGMIPISLVNVNFGFEDIPDLRRKVVIVTGANTGLGKSSAKLLALNGATTIMGCRSLAKCEEAKADIVNEVNGQKKFDPKNLIAMELDLGSLSSINKFTDKFKQNFKRLDSLMLNAGVMTPPFTLTTDGIESQFGVNHVGHFYLTRSLLPLLESSQPSTIVVVSSNGHFLSYPEGVRLSQTALNDPASYDAMAAYGQSKLANVLYAQELSERLKDLKLKMYVNSLNPGGVNTDLGRHWGEKAHGLLKKFLKMFPNKIFFEPDYAALTQVYLSISPDIVAKKITGKYFVPIADECDTSDMAKNITLQKRLWTFTENLIKDLGYA